MRTVILLVAALSTPAALLAQDSVPANLAQVELARSRNCVKPLSQMEKLNQEMAPRAQRFSRLQAIGRAVALEDTSVVSQLDPSDSVEAAVRAWFQQDDRIATRIVATGADSLRQKRKVAKDSIKALLSRSLQAVQAEARARADSAHAQDVEAAAAPCNGMIFVRSAVEAACDGISSELCRLAAADSVKPEDPYRFVATPEALWGVQQFVPWTDPTPLQVGPGGQIVGARTQTRSRQGNVVVSLTVQPLLRPKSSLDSTQVAEAEASLDSLGFTFDHPDFVMTPALSLQMNVTKPLGGETNYVLYFGNLGDADVLWSTNAGSTAPSGAVIPLTSADLKKLEQGTPLGFAAVKVPEGTDAKAQAVYSITFLPVNEAKAVSALAGYMSSKLGEDLKTLVPPKNG